MSDVLLVYSTARPVTSDVVVDHVPPPEVDPLTGHIVRQSAPRQTVFADRTLVEALVAPIVESPVIDWLLPVIVPPKVNAGVEVPQYGLPDASLSMNAEVEAELSPVPPLATERVVIHFVADPVDCRIIPFEP